MRHPIIAAGYVSPVLAHRCFSDDDDDGNVLESLESALSRFEATLLANRAPTSHYVEASIIMSET